MVEPRFEFGHSEDGMKIRLEVFVDEQGFVDEFDEFDKIAWHLVLYLDGYPISTGRIYPLDPETYRIGRVAVRKSFRGQKVGTYTMKFLMNKALQLGARKVVLDAQLDKVPFYKSLRFKAVTGEVFLEEGAPHVAMEKVIATKRKVYRKK